MRRTDHVRGEPFNWQASRTPGPVHVSGPRSVDLLGGGYFVHDFGEGGGVFGGVGTEGGGGDGEGSEQQFAAAEDRDGDGAVADSGFLELDRVPHAADLADL